MIDLTVPLHQTDIDKLSAGDVVSLSGEVFTARDAAHQRMHDMLAAGQRLPFDIASAGIFYAGPCPDMPGRVINSCGPTTSSRMDAYAPELYDLGMPFVIGKGPVSAEVQAAIARNHAVYFAAVGGAGALIASHITAAETVAFPGLGTEAIRRLVFNRVPLIVAVDSHGDSIF